MRGVTVLVVDDNDDHRELIERRLRKVGIAVRTATSGPEALERLDGVDLVLLDYRLPGMSGLETLEAIRKLGRPERPDAPQSGPSVIMVTGMGSESLAVDAMRAGAVDYVVKTPHYFEVLPQVVERAWRHHDLARRAGALQRLALLVTSATDREAVFGEIVQGAQRLLRADACAVFVVSDEGLAMAALAGVSPDDPTALMAAAVRTLVAPSNRAPDDEELPTRRLLVPLPGSDGTLGVLAVLTDEPRVYAVEEIGLAHTFASFAGLALAKLHQLELERALVAELQEMLDLRREVVASVSHELRTPLTCISGFANTLERLWEELSDSDRRTFVTKITHHGNELSDLVERQLDFSAAEAGKLVARLSVFELRAEVDAAIESVAPLMSGRPLTVEVQDVKALGDARLVRRTLWNLLSNAVKYSEPGSPVSVRVRQDGAWARIDVVDDGVGMDPDEAARAFEPYWRAEKGRNRTRGTGIGLALVSEYVRLMGGHISVTSEPHNGSTFTFTLPVAEVGARQLAPG